MRYKTMRGAAGFAFTFIAVLLGAWIFLLPLAVRYAVHDALGRLGISASGGQVSIGLDRAEISDIVLSGRDHVTLVARYSANGLAHGRLKTVEIADASFHGKVAADGALVIDGYRFDKQQPTAGTPAIALPADQVVIRQASLALDTPLGPTSLTGKGTLLPTDRGLQLAGEIGAEMMGLRVQTPIKAAYWPQTLTIDLEPIRSQQTTGTVALHLKSGGADLRKQASATLQLRNFGFATPRLTVAGANGVIGFAQLSPIATAGKQHLTIERVIFGESLTDLSLDFAIANGRVLTVGKARGSLMGGEVAIDDQSIDLRGEKQEVTLLLREIDLAQLLALANLSGVSATGKLEGIVPIRHKNDSFQIDNAVLKATEAGVLRYDPADPPSFLKDTRSSEIALLREALKDFHYRTLTVTVSGTIGAEEEIKMALTGSNPSLYDGKTIELNLDFTGSLDKIARWSLQSFANPLRAVGKLKGGP